MWITSCLKTTDMMIRDVFGQVNPYSMLLAILISLRYKSGMITPAQCRAARALLNWSQQRLATAARVGVVTVRQFEKSGSQPRPATMEVVHRALASAGVDFIAENGGGAGVRLKHGRE
jgi:hypothetical protein